MIKHKVEFRRATLEDAKKFYGNPPVRTMRGVVAVLGNDVVGIGGVFYEGNAAIAFSEFKPEMRSRKKDLVIGCRKIMHIVDDMKIPVYAVANKEEGTAHSLLERLGFAFVESNSEIGEIFVRGA